MSLRLPIRRRKNPSAIGLRQILPVQTKRTLFTILERAANASSNLELNGAKSILREAGMRIRSCRPSKRAVACAVLSAAVIIEAYRQRELPLFWWAFR